MKRDAFPSSRPGGGGSGGGGGSAMLNAKTAGSSVRHSSPRAQSGQSGHNSNSAVGAHHHQQQHQQHQVRVVRGISLSQALLSSTTAFVERGSIRLSNARIALLDEIPASTRAATKSLLLGNNYITSIQGLHKWVELESLSVSHNSIKCLHEIDALRHMRRLGRLNLEGNAVTDLPFYRPYVLSLCPSLIFLDNQKITVEERGSCKGDAQELIASLEAMKINQIRQIVLGNIRQVRSISSTIQVLSRRMSNRSHPAPSQGEIPPFEFAKTLRICVKGGVFRMILIYNGSDRFLDLSIQSQLRATCIRELAKTKAASIFDVKDKERRQFFRNALAQYSQRQLQSIISLLSDLPGAESTSSSSSSSAAPSHIAAVESLLLPTFVGTGGGAGVEAPPRVFAKDYYDDEDVELSSHQQQQRLRTSQEGGGGSGGGVQHRYRQGGIDRARSSNEIGKNALGVEQDVEEEQQEEEMDRRYAEDNLDAGCGLGHGFLQPGRGPGRKVPLTVSATITATKTTTGVVTSSSTSSSRPPRIPVDRTSIARLCLDEVGGVKSSAAGAIAAAGEELSRKLPPKQVEPSDSCDSLSDGDNISGVIDTKYGSSSVRASATGGGGGGGGGGYTSGVRRRHDDGRSGSVGGEAIARGKKDFSKESSQAVLAIGEGGPLGSTSSNSNSNRINSNISSTNSSDHRHIPDGDQEGGQAFDMSTLSAATNREIDQYIRAELERDETANNTNTSSSGSSSDSSNIDTGSGGIDSSSKRLNPPTPSIDELLKIANDIWKNEELPPGKSEGGGDVNMASYFGPSPYDPSSGTLIVDLLDKSKERSNVELVNSSTGMRDLKDIVDQYYRLLAARRKDEYLCSKVNEYFWTLVERLKVIMKAKVSDSHKFLKRLQDQSATSLQLIEKYSIYASDQRTLEKVYKEKHNQKLQMEVDLDEMCDACSALQGELRKEEERHKYLSESDQEVQQALNYLAYESTNSPVLRQRLAYNRGIEKIVLLKYSYQFVLMRECFMKLDINRRSCIKVAKFHAKHEFKRYRRIAKYWLQRVKLLVHGNGKFLKIIDFRRISKLQRAMFLKWRMWSRDHRYFNRCGGARRYSSDGGIGSGNRSSDRAGGAGRVPSGSSSSRRLGAVVAAYSSKISVASDNKGSRNSSSNISSSQLQPQVVLSKLQRLLVSRCLHLWRTRASLGQHMARTAFVLRALSRLRKAWGGWKRLHFRHRNRVAALYRLATTVAAKKLKRGYSIWVNVIRFTRTQTISLEHVVNHRITRNIAKFHFSAWWKLLSVVRFQKKLFFIRKFRLFKMNMRKKVDVRRRIASFGAVRVAVLSRQVFASLRYLLYKKRLRHKAANLKKWMQFRHSFRFWKLWRSKKAIALNDTYKECMAIQTYLTSLIRLTFKAWKNHHQLQNKYYLDLITNREVRINIRDSLSPRNSLDIFRGGGGVDKDRDKCDGEGPGAIYRYANGAVAASLDEGVYSAPLKRIKDRLRRYSAKFDRDFYSDAESLPYFSTIKAIDGEDNDGDDSDSDDELHMIEVINARGADGSDSKRGASLNTSFVTSFITSSTAVAESIVARSGTRRGSLLLLAAKVKSKRRCLRKWYSEIRRRRQLSQAASIVTMRHACFGNTRVVNNPIFRRQIGVVSNNGTSNCDYNNGGRMGVADDDGGGGFDNSLPLFDRKRIISRYFYIWNVAFIRRNLKKLSKLKEAIAEKDIEVGSIKVEPERLKELRLDLETARAALSSDAEAVESVNSAVLCLDETLATTEMSLELFAKSLAMLEEERETLATTIQTILSLSQKKLSEKANEKAKAEKSEGSDRHEEETTAEINDKNTVALGLISESAKLQLEVEMTNVGIAQLKKESGYKAKQLSDLTEVNINESRAEVESVVRIKAEVSEQLSLRQQLRQQLDGKVDEVKDLNSKILSQIKFKNDRIAELDYLLASKRDEMEKSQKKLKIMSQRSPSSTGSSPGSQQGSESIGSSSTTSNSLGGGSSDIYGTLNLTGISGRVTNSANDSTGTDAIVLSLAHVTSSFSSSQMASQDFIVRDYSSPDSDSGDSWNKENSSNAYRASSSSSSGDGGDGKEQQQRLRGVESIAIRSSLSFDGDSDSEGIIKERERGEIKSAVSSRSQRGGGSDLRGGNSGSRSRNHRTDDDREIEKPTLTKGGAQHVTKAKSKSSLLSSSVSSSTSSSNSRSPSNNINASSASSSFSLSSTALLSTSANERMDPEDLKLIEEEIALSRRLQARLGSLPSLAATKFPNAVLDAEDTI